MTVTEYQSALDAFDDDEFASFRAAFGGSFTTRRQYVDNFVNHPEHEGRICRLLGLTTEEERLNKASLAAAQAAKDSAKSLQMLERGGAATSRLIAKILVGAATIAGAIFGAMQVPEIREILGLESSPTDSVGSVSAADSSITSEGRTASDSVGRVFLVPANLNILVFHATTDDRAHAWVSRTLRREFPGIDVDAELDWVDKYSMFQSWIFYLDEENRRLAQQFADLMPGEQQVRDYNADPAGFFGLSAQRDLVFLLGDDWFGLVQAFGGDGTTVERR